MWPDEPWWPIWVNEHTPWLTGCRSTLQRHVKLIQKDLTLLTLVRHSHHCCFKAHKPQKNVSSFRVSVNRTWLIMNLIWLFKQKVCITSVELKTLKNRRKTLNLFSMLYQKSKIKPAVSLPPAWIHHSNSLKTWLKQQYENTHTVCVRINMRGGEKGRCSSYGEE